MSPLKALDWLAPNQLENVRIVFSNNDSELTVNLLAFHTHLEESKLADMIRLPDKRKRSALLASCIDADDHEYTMERQVAESILSRFEIGDMENAVRLCEETSVTVQADLRIQFTGSHEPSGMEYEFATPKGYRPIPRLVAQTPCDSDELFDWLYDHGVPCDSAHIADAYYTLHGSTYPITGRNE